MAATQHWRKLTVEQHDAVVARFKAGELCKDLAHEYGISTSLIYAEARRRGFSSFVSLAGRPRKPINEAAFSNLTPDVAYWIGFLMADGCITSGGRRLQLQLAERDRGHIETFKRFLGAEHKIRSVVCRPNKLVKARTRHSILAVTCARIVADLASYGVVPRKSAIAQCIGLDGNRDFWRGVVDGNGTLGWVRDKRGQINPSITLCGSFPLMQQFASFADIHAVGGPRRRRPVAVRARTHSLYVVSVGHSRAVSLASVLYDGAETALERKRVLALRMFSA